MWASKYSGGDILQMLRQSPGIFYSIFLLFKMKSCNWIFRDQHNYKPFQNSNKGNFGHNLNLNLNASTILILIWFLSFSHLQAWWRIRFVMLVTAELHQFPTFIGRSRAPALEIKTKVPEYHAKISQLRRWPLLWPSPGWKRLLALSPFTFKTILRCWTTE